MSSDSASSRPKHPRPSTVTVPCVFIAVTAFLTLTGLITALMDWGTVDMQDFLQRVLRWLADAGAPLSMAEGLRGLRWILLALVPFSIATMVYAIFALRGDRPARVVTTTLAAVGAVLSLPLGVFGILQAAMLLLAAGALWTPEAARWYRGEPAAEPAQPTHPALLAAPLPPEPAPSGAPRPTSVIAAGLLTIFGSLVVGAFATVYLLVTTFARDAYLEAVKTGPFHDLLTAKELDLAMRVTFWASIGVLPLALAGLLGGWALLAGRRIGRSATLWWAWTSAILGLVAFPPGLVATIGAGAVIVLLLRDDARQWTTSR